MKLETLTALLRPRSVAVVGATERPDASSHFVMRNLIDHGFSGEIYPVHPKAEQVFGYPAVASLAKLAEAPDLAIICIGAQHVPSALAEAGQLGTKAAIVLSSGFAEIGPEGIVRQAELVAIAKSYEMALCGPNCLGIVALQHDTVLYSSRFPQGIPKGRLALISQSGASAIALSGSGRLGFSYIVSAGNSAVTDIADYLDYLARDDDSDVIALVLENIRQPARLAAAIGRVKEAGKTIIALYFGRTDTGATATTAHTGALTTSYQAVADFWQRHGVAAVRSMDELLETAALFTQCRPPPDRKGIALLGVSGGGVAHVADFAAEAGLNVPPLSSQTISQLRGLLPGYTTPQNPLDTTGLPFADGSIYQRVMELLAADPAIGLIVAVQDVPVALDPDGAAEYLPIAKGIVDYTNSGTIPVLVISNLAAGHHPIFKEILQSANVPVLNGTAAAMQAITAWLNATRPMPIGIRPPVPLQAKWSSRLDMTKPLTESEAKAFLADYGVRTTKTALATSADEAALLSEKIGFPVVLKVESAEISHKSDVGGVQLNLPDVRAVRDAFNQISESVKTKLPTAAIEGISVQEMVNAPMEAFIGISRHAPFGHGIVIGVGGLYVELMGQHAFALLPLDQAAVERLLAQSPLSGLLSGYRGQPAGDQTALINLILKLDQLLRAYGEQIETLELNPVAILPPGQGICILDALLLTSAQQSP